MLRRENRRNHARHVEFQRQVRRLAAIDLAPDLALRVVDQDAALAALDETHECRNTGDQAYDHDHGKNGYRALALQFQRIDHRGEAAPRRCPRK